MRCSRSGIGVGEIAGAQDEYDSYVPAIYEMLIARKSRQEVFDYLWWLATEYMGLTGNPPATEKFVDRLLQIPDEVDKAAGLPPTLMPSNRADRR